MISRSFQTVRRMREAWKRETCSVSVFFVRVGSQISPRRAKKDSNIPSPGRTRLVKCPTPGPTKTIKSPPHAPPRRHDIDSCINFEPPIPNNTFLSYKSLTRRYVQGNHYKYRESKQYISAQGISWDRNIVLIFYIMTIVKNVWKNVIALNRTSIESFRSEFTANL